MFWLAVTGLAASALRWGAIEYSDSRRAHHQTEPARAQDPSRRIRASATGRPTNAAAAPTAPGQAPHGSGAAPQAADLTGRVAVLVRDARAQSIAGAQVRVGCSLTTTLATDTPAAAQVETPATSPQDVGTLVVTEGPVPAIPLRPNAVSAGPGAADDSAAAEATCTTDRDGLCSVQTVSDRPCTRLFVTHQRFAPTALMVPRPGRTQKPIVVVMDSGFSVAGRVQSPLGAPLPNQHVELTQEALAQPWTTQTDAAGGFTFRSVSGTFQLSAFAESGAVSTVEAVASADAANMALTLVAGELELLGMVVDKRQSPIAQARIQLRLTGGDAVTIPPTSTTADGAFRFRHLNAGRYTVTIVAPGFAPLAATVSLPSVEPTPFVLNTGVLLEARVHDHRRRPVPQATIELRQGEQRHRAQSDMEGSFSFSDLTGGPCSIIVTAPDCATSELSVVLQAQPFGRAQELEIEMRPGATIAGTVVDRMGTPIPSAMVTVTDGSQTLGAQSDDIGEFTVEGVPVTTVEVKAEHPAFEMPTPRVRLDLGVRRPPRNKILRFSERWSGEPAVPATTGNDGNAAPVAAVNLPRKSGLFTTPRLQLQSSPEGITVTASDRPDIHPGDRLIQIDGERVFAAGQARSMLRGRSGSRVTLDMRRGRKKVRLSIARP